jgi:hypothetical protein
MAVTTSYSGSRRANARAAAFAAKQKRQKMIIGVGLVLLVLILAYEVPHTLKMMHGTAPRASEPVATDTTASAGATTTAPAHKPSALWRTLKHTPASNPFSSGVAGKDPADKSVSVPSGLGDPYAPTVKGEDPAATSAGATADGSAGPTVSTVSTSLPKTIVVGSPGAGRTAKTGWILILASIPSSQGRAAANAFAKKAAGRGVGSISILNSSNAKPLRGGYWVVYTGPFPTLSDVNDTASQVHAAGYATAYVRQLVVYGKKSN